MLWRRKLKPQWDQAKAEYEWAIEAVYGGSFTLAAARLLRKVGYKAKNLSAEDALEKLDETLIIGVLHEWPAQQRHIPCEFEFDDHPEKPEFVGWCCLGHSHPIGFQKLPERLEEQPIHVHGKIYDPEHQFRREVHDALKDAAISGYRFVHIKIHAEKVGYEKANQHMREHRFGSYIGIISTQLIAGITLPSAPEWGWKREGE